MANGPAALAFLVLTLSVVTAQDGVQTVYTRDGADDDLDSGGDPPAEEFVFIEVGFEGEQTMYPRGGTKHNNDDMENFFRHKFLVEDHELWKDKLVHWLKMEQKVKEELSMAKRSSFGRNQRSDAHDVRRTLLNGYQQQQRYATMRLEEIKTSLQVLRNKHGFIPSVEEKYQYDWDENGERTESRRLSGGETITIPVSFPQWETKPVDVDVLVTANVEVLLENYKKARTKENLPNLLTGYLSLKTSNKPHQRLDPHQTLKAAGIQKGTRVYYISTPKSVEEVLQSSYLNLPLIVSLTVAYDQVPKEKVTLWIRPTFPEDDDGGKVNILEDERLSAIQVGFKELKKYFEDPRNGYKVDGKYVQSNSFIAMKIKKQRK